MESTINAEEINEERKKIKEVGKVEESGNEDTYRRTFPIRKLQSNYTWGTHVVIKEMSFSKQPRARNPLVQFAASFFHL